MWKTGRAASSSALICRLMRLSHARAQNVGAAPPRRGEALTGSRRTVKVTDCPRHTQLELRAHKHTHTHTASGLGFVQYLIIACR